MVLCGFDTARRGVSYASGDASPLGAPLEIGTNLRFMRAALIGSEGRFSM